MNFEVTILGSSAALPTLNRNATAQFVTCCNRNILIDCGEGTQLQMRKFKVKFQKLNVILISHLHGDHYFGLVGLISSMRLLGRNRKLTIVCPEGLQKIIESQLEIGNTKLDFDINYIELQGNETRLVFEDKLIEILTFPLKHKIPTNGFLIREKEQERNMIPEMLNHPLLKIEYIHRLKKGEDVTTENGKVLKFLDFTVSPNPPRSYAFCSDTAYFEKIIPVIKNVNVLYHEATFSDQHQGIAKSTMHSTAVQAAKIAQQAQVGSLYLGHLSARYDSSDLLVEEAKTLFEKTVYVHDGMKISITDHR